MLTTYLVALFSMHPLLCFFFFFQVKTLTCTEMSLYVLLDMVETVTIACLVFKNERS